MPLHISSPLYNQFVIKLQLKKLKNQLLNFLSTSAGNWRQKRAFLILRTALAPGRAVKNIGHHARLGENYVLID